METKRKPRGYWTPDRVKDALKERLLEGSSLQARVVFTEHSSLYQKALGYYGSWDKVLTELGENPVDHKKPTERRYKDKASLVRELQARRVDGRGNSIKAVQKDDYTLYLYARIYFGGWEGALIASGEDPRDTRAKGNPKYWTPDTILKHMTTRLLDGESLQAKDIHKTDISLYRQVLKKFGTWDAVYTAMGENPVNHKGIIGRPVKKVAETR